MTSALPPIKIHFLHSDEQDDEVPLTDVGVVNIDGERHLFLAPQSFYSAVRQIKIAMPDLTGEQVERLVRDHCEFKDFDELLAPPVEHAPLVDLPPLPQEPPTPVRSRGRTKKWAIAAALLPAFAGTWALGHGMGATPASSATSAPDAALETESDRPVSDNQNLGPEPFTNPDFLDFSTVGKIHCSPIDNLEAECTDADGMVMATKAATGPDSTIFTFSYGSERIGLRVFGTAEYARTWTQQDGSRELYPNMVRSGRYVLWGTDEARLLEYENLLVAAPGPTPVQSSANVYVMGVAEPLPPRLAALAFGTLGLNESEVHTILFDPQDAPVDAPTLMAARAVLGVQDGTTSAVEPGEEDIVALAAGLEVPPYRDGSGTPITLPATDPVAEPPEDDDTYEESEPPDPTPSTKPEAQKTSEPEKPVAPAPSPEPEQPTDPAPPAPTAPAPDPADPAPVPADPTPPVNETPDEPQEPDQTEARPPTEEPNQTGTQPPGSDAADEPPVTDRPKPEQNDDQDEGDGELTALPPAWIATAA
ncbi:hypothetical protein OG413_20135 [Streptomyces sp. NBC_01433]|uniref:hypothetical protein n=1 Tax=Streptomyces sp. NBC_01433 TaxID=2903864 RepID=UPI002251812D|nr:hypothetical protein [Streptomyces sp. NBC_01433]MCX4677584.1 hypothetical protein [Streptomyces sp. NBC_01433]